MEYNFFSNENQRFLNSTRQKSSNWKRNKLKIQPKHSLRCRCQWAGSTNEKKLFTILFFIANRGLTRIGFPSVLAVKVTTEISNRKNLD